MINYFGPRRISNHITRSPATRARHTLKMRQIQRQANRIPGLQYRMNINKAIQRKAR